MVEMLTYAVEPRATLVLCPLSLFVFAATRWQAATAPYLEFSFGKKTLLLIKGLGQEEIK